MLGKIIEQYRKQLLVHVHMKIMYSIIHLSTCTDNECTVHSQFQNLFAPPPQINIFKWTKYIKNTI